MLSHSSHHIGRNPSIERPIDATKHVEGVHRGKTTDYSKVMATISDFVPMRIVGPQVPTPLVV